MDFVMSRGEKLRRSFTVNSYDWNFDTDVGRAAL
jgi:hypothetical protein